MQKKGEAATVIKTFLIAAVVIAIIFFGYFSVTSIQERICTTELAEFEILFTDLHQELRGGVVDERSFVVPCGATQIYFVDVENLPDPQWFSEFPLMQDSIESKTDSNVFVYKGDELLRSFPMGGVELPYPHFSCVSPLRGKVSLLLEGKGKRLGLVPACEQPECGFFPEAYDKERVNDALADSIEFVGCNGCVEADEIGAETIKARQTYDNVDIFRRYDYCEDKTFVELKIKPKDGVSFESFRFFESIPKECIEDLNEALSDYAELGGNDIVQIKPDPLIMWHFEELDEEQKIFYELLEELPKECAQRIKSGAVAETIIGGTVDEEVRPGEITPEVDTNQDTSDTESITDTEIPDSYSIISTPITEAKVGALYEYTVQVDTDKLNIWYTFNTNPPGMTIDSATGLIRWGPESAGEHHVKVYAINQDRPEQREHQIFTIQVYDDEIGGLEG